MVHLNGPYCELRTSQATNYNSSFHLGQVFHIYLSVRSSFFAVFERSTSNCHLPQAHLCKDDALLDFLCSSQF